MIRKRTEKPFAGQITTPPPAPWLSSPMEADTPPAAESQVKLQDIHLPPQQPRRYFDPQALTELVASVKQHGILQPLLVRPLAGGKYELVAGERRYRAATEVGLEEVPVVVRELSDDQAFQLALIENLQRQDLNPVEETEGILHLLAIRLSCDVEAVKSLLYRMKNASSKGEKQLKNSEEQSRRNVSPNVDDEKAKKVQEVFESLGLMNWLSFTTKRVPLLNMPLEILTALREGKLEYTKAQALARVKDDALCTQLLDQAIAHNWSLSEIKAQIAANTQPAQPPFSKSPNQIPERLKNVTQSISKRKLWEQPAKQKKLETLLSKLEALLGDE
ncbi:ParB/RepB/Spo0J family partition protein [Anabaena cylindrica FACHB-243]|uniref:ParB-like partition protein n=1 Tax=Anabaena cylindrica (strain ATCC 27899 / PCC 7122) TaxID=272123 RepID=K9ZRJ6_ANACC|nr:MULTISPECIES: ParB/RepB/Spo0J family partition protein [Anabaena]AFZ61389.1 parB-like partition protein [Anabaena cylindrica PCC 7122]MBD2420386.1 ParB/RepB/Spo0J family partition protein [Anabaena cylindrica FACHB-243]MBY5281878.1 ParB/RepB/Spo0J family partition protein [Anabaena sp. CCAP 1446/1C]MBY5306973.1 ParB/RepB/Spo0J family partition protein [Anabaena sp. CCAP 1446/1C]MCM2405991.1 ParB/RepB/Spo0J family partition protein [Anabaena sp. CCAP 1446/1C]